MLPLFGGACALGASAQDADDAQQLELHKDTPKLDKLPEKKPLRAGIEHNATLEQKQQKQKKKALKSRASRNGFDGKRRGGATVGGTGLKSGADNSMLQSATQRGIGIIGVRFEAMEGFPPRVQFVFPGTPAANVGVLPNDFIVAVDGVPTVGLTKDECYDLIVGTPNTPVTLSLRRGGGFLVRTMNRMDFTELSDPSIRNAYGFHL